MSRINELQMWEKCAPTHLCNSIQVCVLFVKKGIGLKMKALGRHASVDITVIGGYCTLFSRAKSPVIIIIMIINLIYTAQFDAKDILTALYIVIKYIEMQYVHI